ncbi:MAG: glycosyltransferase [Treponema sp.]|nr:glycosyltransferase [Treponema sp.]
MKILVLNYNDSFGGAAIAAYKLTQALNAHGIKADLGVVEKQQADDFVFEIPKKGRKKSILQKIARKSANYAKRLVSPFSDRLWKNSFSTTNRILHSTNEKSIIDVDWINNSDYDVVNLHWINRDMISIPDIAKIKKPIVWTMHDTWPFCGAEHYPNVLEKDERFKYGYTKSNKPASTKGKDVCRIVWEKKKRFLSDLNITFISPSNYEKDCIQESALFSHKKCAVIPNVIDKQVFFPQDSRAIKEIFGIPADKKTIAFGASYGIDDPASVKGSYHLVNALKNLKSSDDYFLVVFGKASPAFFKNFSIPYFAAGEISNPHILSAVYNMCDVFVCPSLIENLPFTCLESVCCHIPVTAFNVGGIPDIVEHEFNGYLAKPYDDTDLAAGIEYCLSHRDELSKNCAQIARRFDTDETVKKYYNVYEYALNNK